MFPLSVKAQNDSARSDTAYFIIRKINVSGNKTTKLFVIEREYTFHEGDTVPRELFFKTTERTRQNLLNTSLFNFVTVTPLCIRDTVHPECMMTDIEIQVKERWYTWPAPVFEVMEQNLNTWWANGHNLQRATYGFLLTRYNFRGRKESVAAIAKFGYAQQIGAQYSVPYLNKKQTLGVTVTGTYTLNHEVAYNTAGNKLMFYKDKEHYIRKETGVALSFTYREGLYVRHNFDVKYSGLEVDDTVLNLSSDYFPQNHSKLEYITLSWRMIRDYRDIKPYPLKGHYEEIEVTRHGVGLLPDENLNVTYITAGVRKYGQLMKRVFGGAMIRGRWLPGKNPPYYHQRALGFSTYVRGYEYYVVDGQSYVLAKTAVKYQILKPHIFSFDFIPLEKFNTLHLALYAGLFADAAWVNDRASQSSDQNSLGNSLLYGYGAGFDIVTYYDMAFRIEYAFNGKGESGFFFHMGAPF